MNKFQLKIPEKLDKNEISIPTQKPKQIEHWNNLVFILNLSNIVPIYNNIC